MSSQRLGSETLTRCRVHQLVGEWVDHLPVCSWLRVACGYLQWCTARDGIGWDDQVSESTMAKVQEIVARLKLEGDPAQGC